MEDIQLHVYNAQLARLGLPPSDNSAEALARLQEAMANNKPEQL
jgi:hypothetical protein